MRFAPAAAALSVVAALTASAAVSADRAPDPRAAVLIAEGSVQLQAGQTQAAIDSFEAALAVDPGYSEIYNHLAEAARAEGLQGKAIRYYRETLERDPDNLAAIAGEGAALVEKGAVDRAKDNLATLEGLCGSSCAETRQLAAAITRGPMRRMANAEMLPADDAVTQN